MRYITKNSKRIKLKERLSLRITGGEFHFGDRFPGLHQICKEYDVSYVTANKAMKILVKEGYLQAKNGIGYFVCYVPSDIIPPRKVVNFITGLNKESSIWHFIVYGKELFESAGWNVNLRTIPEGDLSSIVSDINSPDAYTVLIFTRVNWENFTATFRHVTQRVVVLGHLSGNTDITSIISDEYESVRRCIEKFRQQNHFRTGLVSISPHKELDTLRIAAWRSIMISYGADIAKLDKLCFTPELSRINNDATVIKAYSDWVRENKDQLDSVIDPFSPDFLAKACEENGLKVPDDIAIIRIARSLPVESEYPIPTLDNNLPGHFHYALTVLEERFRTGKKAPGAWLFCPPGNFLE